MQDIVQKIKMMFGTITGLVKALVDKLWALISNTIGWLMIKIFGEEKIERFSQNLNNFKNKISQQYESRVDRDSRYYKLVSKSWKIFFWTAVSFCFFIFCLQTNFLYLTGQMPSVSELQNPKLSQASEIYYSDGVTLMSKFFTENRTPVKEFKDLSPNLVNALIATEDARFYEHSGIDYKALLGVAVGLIKNGGERGGGSTLTQQTAKNLFKTRIKKGFLKTGVLGYIPLVSKIVYKLKEWLTAIQLERFYTKEEIALMYLNTVDYSSNSYGIKVASRTYFNKSPDSLNIQEAAVLVGLVNAPTAYNPMLHIEKSTQRRNIVLRRMAKYNYISTNVADSISKIPIKLSINIEQQSAGYDGYYKKAITDQLKKWADENDTELNLYTDGLKIVSTIDYRMQGHAESAVLEGMKSLQRTFENHWANKNPWCYEDGAEILNFIDSSAVKLPFVQKLKEKYKATPDSVWYYLNVPHKMRVFSWKDPDGEYKTMSSLDSIRYYKKLLQAGMMTIDPFNGHVKAYVGGLDFAFFKYDHVKQAKRQPGSTFKPFVYCAAIDGPANLSPCERVRDEPFKIEIEEKGEKKQWAPKNADGRFSYRDYTFRQAMAKSVNSCAVKLTDRIGADTVKYYAQKLGITSKLQAVPSIGLGTFDVSLFEMVSAYCPFANGGLKTEPIIVWKIEDANGHVLHEFSQKSDREQVISEESSFLMRFMLQGGMQEQGGTSQNLWSWPALFPNGNAEYGGKTGTTSNYSDGWYMGLTRDLITGVWVGGDDRSIHFKTGAYGEGSKTALPIFGRYMTKIFADKDLDFKPGPFPKPGLKITKEYLSCSNTGGYAGPSRKDSTATGSDSVFFVNPESSPDVPVLPDSTGNN